MMPKMIAETLQKYIAEAAGVAPEEVFLEHPSDRSHGDYACNIALVAAKKEGSPPAGGPRKYAEALAEKLSAEKPDEVERVEVAGSGFINIWLSREFFTRTTKEILESGEQWGSNTELSGEKVMIEYTSPNLFKPLHIGNLVGNISGESLSRLQEMSGASVVRINYPSDIGLTVAKGVWGLWKHDLNPDDIGDLGRAYVLGNQAYEEDDESKQEIEDINKELYEGTNTAWTSLRERGIETSRKHLDHLCERLGTRFDKEFFESESSVRGKEIVEAHIGDVFEESDGAVVYRGEKQGLHTRVFLNSKGLPTYEAKDVGLFALKTSYCPDSDTSITVTGNEQAEYFKVVFAVLKELFPKEASGQELRHVANGFLRLPSGKMSSRTGDVVTAESLLEALEGIVRDIIHERGFEHEEAKELEEAVAVAAIKYSILKQASGKDIVFDVDQELSFEGDSGPYLQYAHTRARSVLEKAAKEGVAPSAEGERATKNELERLLYRFPEVALRAAREYEPHYVTTYLTELAGVFNSWYASEQILDGTDAAAYKLALTKAFATTMKNGLWVLGIRAPERM